MGLLRMGWTGSVRSAGGLTLVALALAVVLAGCGGSSSTTSSGMSGSPAAAAATTSGLSVDAVAYVAKTPIPKASYEHWLAVEEAAKPAGVSLNHLALAFLITSDWMLGEASAQHVSVSDTEVKHRFAELKTQGFPKAGSLQKFLVTSHQTEADLLARTKVELLRSRVTAKAIASKGGSQSKAVLASFQKAFQQRWKNRTTCNPGYIMEDCSEYKGHGENLTVTSSSSAPKSTPKTATSKLSPELPPSAAGAMALSSPAFGLNEAIPAKYTCDGTGISPPLQWKNVPAKAAALILFVIGDSGRSPASGIRWIVGDINPRSKGVAAGKTPEGGIVGSDTQGHTGYGGICPPHGKTSRIEFLMYALSKPISLSPGFSPAIAEHEFGRAGHRLPIAVAVTYGAYQRP